MGLGDVNEAYIVVLEVGLKVVGFFINVIVWQWFEDYKVVYIVEFVKLEGFQAMMQFYDLFEIDYIDIQLEKVVVEVDVGIFIIGCNSGEGGDWVEEDDFFFFVQE